MMYMWSAIQFTYYEFNLSLRYLPGDIFSNAFASSLAEIIGVMLGGLLYRIIGFNKGLVVSFVISTAGAIFII